MPDIISQMDSNDFLTLDEEAREHLKLVDSTTLAEIIHLFNDWVATDREMAPEDSPYHDCLDEEQRDQVIDVATTLLQQQRKDREQLLAQVWDRLDLKPLYND